MATTRGYLVALVCAVVLSTTGVFIRYLIVEYSIPPLVLVFWRQAFTVIALATALGVVRPRLLRVGKGELPYLFGYGLVLALYNTIYTLSAKMNGAAVSTVLVYSSAAYCALIGWLWLKEGLNWARVLSTAICLWGCAIVSGATDPAVWRGNIVGVFTGVASGICLAAYTTMGRRASQKNLNPWTTLLYTFGFAACVMLLLNVTGTLRLAGGATKPADMFWLARSAKAWGVLILLAAGPTAVGFGLYNMSLVYLPSTVANLIVSTEVFFTAIAAYFLLSERFTLTQANGGLLLMAGVVCLRLFDRGIALPRLVKGQQISRPREHQA